MSLFQRIGLTSVLALLAVACSGERGPGIPLSGLESLRITPVRSAVGIGGSERFVAMAHYADGTSLDASSVVSWSLMGGDGVASIDAEGIAFGLALGTTSVTASFQGQAAAAFFEVERLGREGRRDAPRPLPLETPHAGTVNTGSSHYVFDVEPGRAHYVFVTGATDDLNLFVWSDPERTALLCSVRSSADDLTCVTDPPPSGDRLYVDVDGVWTDTFFGGKGGAEFTLEVVPGWLDEGSETPVTLTLDEPHQGGVGLWRSRYVVPVVHGAEYTVRLGGATSPVSLELETRGCREDGPVAGDQPCVRRVRDETLEIVVYGTQTRTGAGYVLEVEQTDPPLQAEGSVDAPMTPSMPHDGQVDGGRSHYAVDVVAGRSYRVRLEGALRDTRLAVYDGDATFFDADCNLPHEQACELIPVTSDRLYVAVWNPFDELGTRFRLVVEALGWTAEDLVIGAPPLQHAGQVDGTVSRYEVPVVSGAQYEVAVRHPANDVALAVYGDAALSSLLCASNGEGDESCLATATGDRLFVAVDGGGGFGGTFTLEIDRLYESEGTELAPVSLSAGDTRPSQVGPDAPSWYRVPVSAGRAYRVEISGATDDAFFQLYDTESRTGTGRCSGWADGVCELLPVSSNELWIRINAAYTDHGSGFDLSVTELPLAPEGTVSSPIDLGAFPLSHVEATDDTASHYRVAVAAGATYRVELTGRAVVADLRVYADAGFTQLLCASETAGLADESCLAAVSGSALFVKVDGSPSGFGSIYALSVDRHYVSEGVIAARPRDPGPVVVTRGVPWSGQVSDKAPSYYQAAVTAGAPVTVTISGLTGEAYLYVYSDATFTTSIGRDDASGIGDKQVVLSQASADVVHFKVVRGFGSSGSAYSVLVE